MHSDTAKVAGCLLILIVAIVGLAAILVGIGISTKLF